MNSMEHIKPGDQVVVVNRVSDSLITVERVTKTQIIVGDGLRYRRSDGYAVNRGRYYVTYIRDATDEDRTRITYREATRRAEAALNTSRLSVVEQNQVQPYKDRLLEAKAIIDSAFGSREEA